MRVNRSEQEEQMRVADAIRGQIQDEKWVAEASIGLGMLACIIVLSVSPPLLVVAIPAAIVASFLAYTFARQILLVLKWGFLLVLIAIVGLCSYLMVASQLTPAGQAPDHSSQKKAPQRAGH